MADKMDTTHVMMEGELVVYRNEPRPGEPEMKAHHGYAEWHIAADGSSVVHCAAETRRLLRKAKRQMLQGPPSRATCLEHPSPTRTTLPETSILSVHSWASSYVVIVAMINQAVWPRPYNFVHFAALTEEPP